MSCSSKEETPQQTADYEMAEHEEWITYEGVVRSETGNDVKLQLSLLQNSVGMESKYRTEEEYISPQEDRLLTNRQGKYSILYGSGSDMVVTLHESKGISLGWELGSGYAMSPNLPSEELLANAKFGKLIFKAGRNSNELVLLDENSNPISDDNRYTLKKRSLLFTVEGFVTFEPNVTDFFEMHTRDTWTVAKAGSYGEVQKKYNKLVTERHEGIYTKAVAFYVDDIDSTGAEVKNLVIKRIITMKAHKDYIRE